MGNIGSMTTLPLGGLCRQAECPRRLHGDTIYQITPLERDFENALLDLYGKWLTIGYRAARLKPLFDRKGGVAAVKQLLSGNLKADSGFIRLARAGKLDWTVEALLTSSRRWRPLFTDIEIEKARCRYQTALLLQVVPIMN